MRMMDVCAMVLVIALLVGGCGSDSDDVSPAQPAPTSSTSSATETDPYGLARLDTPKNQEEAASAFRQLPEEIAGFARTSDPSPITVRYIRAGRPELVIEVLTTEQAFGEGGTTFADWVRQSKRTEDLVVTAEHVAVDALSFIVGHYPSPASGTEPAYEFFLAAWNPPGSNLLFSVGADSAEARDELVRAYIEAVDA